MTAAQNLNVLLFVPGNRPDRFAKALASGTDIACIDLEDAVPEVEKPAARVAALGALAEGNPRLALRINSPQTRAGWEDVLALADAPRPPSLLLLPKIESAAEVELVRSVLGGRAPLLVPGIETPRGLAAATVIAAGTGVAAMLLGGADLSTELGVELNWEALRVPRALFALACASAGITAIDAPFLGLEDAEGLAVETRAVKALGFTAKAAIHPAQVPIIQAALRPAPAEVAEAQEAERVFQNAAGAAVRFRGRLLDVPIMRRYRRILGS